MLRIDDISYAVAGRSLFEGASATIPAGHKVGLVGRNGAGKTTLFRLIRGELSLEGGTISLPAGARIGGVAQEAAANDRSLIDTVLAADQERAALMAEADTATAPARIAEIQTRLADIDAWSGEARAATILTGLGFEQGDLTRPTSDFSGGWRMRVALAGVLFAQPDLLLLDEPTNYLDLEGALWLETYLARYPHSVIVISHDRGLLNRAVGAILHLEDRALTLYQGGYDQFARQRAERRAQAAATAKKQQARRDHLQSYVDRFRYKASKAKQAQARLKMIARMDMIAAPEDAARARFTFPAPDQLSPPILRLEDAATGYGDRRVLSGMSLRLDADDRIALLGRNGQGKSTLSKLLAGRLELQAGQVVRASALRVGYFAQHQVDELDLDETPLAHLRRAMPDVAPTKLRAQLAGFGLGADQADTPVAQLSGGQKARLSLVLATREAPHLLILDEPTNHLDIESREALIEALIAYAGAVVLVSHDMHLLSLVADRLWLVQGGRVTPYEDDLDAYRALLLGQAPPRGGDKPARSAPPRKGAKGGGGRDAIATLRAEVRRCEERVEKLTEMRDKLHQKLGAPDLYQPGRDQDARRWQDKYAEVETALERAEALWIAAMDRLEQAEG